MDQIEKLQFFLSLKSLRSTKFCHGHVTASSACVY